MKTVTLTDGSAVGLQPIRPEDEPELSGLYSRLSPESAYQRFLTAMKRLPPNWAHILVHVDYERRMAIVAVGPGDRLIAVARYDYDAVAEDTEIALVVEDRWRGKGDVRAWIIDEAIWIDRDDYSSTFRRGKGLEIR